MKPSTLIIALLSVALLSGCITVNTNRLESFSPEQRQKVVRPTAPLGELTRSDTVYLVNDQMVKQFLADKDLAIVHGYLTWCKSDYCISPALAHEKLQQTGLPFLMIAGDYESATGYNALYPFLTIDSEYYQTHNYSKSIKRMYQALGCGDNWWQLYFLFRHGTFIGSANTLDELMLMVKQRTAGCARIQTTRMSLSARLCASA